MPDNIIRKPAQPGSAALHGPGTENSVNESTPVDQRSGALRSPLGDGPVIGDKGVYLPAAYPMETTIIKGEKEITVKLTREDR